MRKRMVFLQVREQICTIDIGEHRNVVGDSKNVGMFAVVKVRSWEKVGRYPSVEPSVLLTGFSWSVLSNLCVLVPFLAVTGEERYTRPISFHAFNLEFGFRNHWHPSFLQHQRAKQRMSPPNIHVTSLITPATIGFSSTSSLHHRTLQIWQVPITRRPLSPSIIYQWQGV
ncbi:hypothetical protein BT69DRAFT_157693 [Atractiella rhizophila]|nr:hypothetical protein BT69DRAFT_157693 [Atractiella rhizophila]